MHIVKAMCHIMYREQNNWAPSAADLKKKKIIRTKLWILMFFSFRNDFAKCFLFRLHIFQSVLTIFQGERMGAVSCSTSSTANNSFRHGLQVVRPANPGEEIDNRFRRVHVVISQFGCFVIPWENVVIVVPSFTGSQEGHHSVFGRIDLPVVNKSIHINGGSNWKRQTKIYKLWKLTCRKDGFPKCGRRYWRAR